MKWYNILFIMAAYVIGVYLHIAYKDYLKNRHHNDSWKKNR